MKGPAHWARILTEGSAIVVSILLAFAIQAWWEGRQSRALEQDTLDQLAGQFSTIEPVLEDWQGRHAAAAEACEILLDHLGPSPSAALTSDSVAGLISVIRVPYRVNPPLATLTALESSGQLAAVQDRQLMVELASWRALLEDLREDEEATSRTIFDNLIPFLIEHAAMRTIDLRHPEGGGVLNSSAASAFPIDHRALLSSPVFENLVEDRRMRAVNVVKDYDIVLDGLSTLRTSIEQQRSQ